MTYLPQIDKLEIRLLENIFLNMTNSYKIYWFNSVFEEILEGKKVISFKNIVVRMISEAWYPLLTYHLNFGTQDQLQKVVFEINEKYIKDKSIKKEELYKELVFCKNEDVNRLISIFYRYVPYRLLTSFYEEELRREKDGAKNKIIEELSMNDSKVLYRVSSKCLNIEINDCWFDYIYDNQNIIRGWIKYKMLDYLQYRNPNVPAIIYKLSPPIERNLDSAKKYWYEVIEGINIQDIYTGLDFCEDSYLKLGNISIDHFIPWSFVGHDKLWNLIPTFSKVNSSKNDNLPKLNKHIDLFCKVQFKGIEYIRKHENGSKYLEDYLNINSCLDISGICSINGQLNESKFNTDLKSTIEPLYQIAYNQGFNEWSYEKYNIINKDIEKL